MMLTAPFTHPETLIKAAQALEHRLPKTGHRLMNLPTPHGPADLVHVQMHHRPEGYRPAHLGHMLSRPPAGPTSWPPWWTMARSPSAS